MSKLIAHVMVVALGLVAAILACQLPGSTGATPSLTATARSNSASTATPSATTLGAGGGPPAGSGTPDVGTGTPDLGATPVHNTPSIEQAAMTYTSQAKTQAAQTVTATAARAQPTPKPNVLKKGAPGALPRQLNLSLDGKGNLTLFGVAPGGVQGQVHSPGGPRLFDLAPASAGPAIFHQQLGPDGNWTQPQSVATQFNVLALAPQLEGSGTPCLLWGGELTGGPSPVPGVFQSCPNTDGSWPAVTEPIAKPLSPTGVRVVAVAPGPGLTAGALYLGPVNNVEALFFSPIDLMATHAALAADPVSVSKGLSVIEAELAIDPKGGLHALWLESSGGTDIAIQASDSADKGKTWSAPQKLYSGNADNPSSVVMQLVADPAGNVHAAWEGDRNVIYRRWTAAAGWGDVAVLSGDNTLLNRVERLAVTADGLARAVWTQFTGNVPQLVYSAQAADGTWDPPQPVADDRASDLALCVDGQAANHVVWSGQADMRYATWAP